MDAVDLDGYHLKNMNTRKWLTYFHDMLLELSTRCLYYHFGDVITGSSTNRD